MIYLAQFSSQQYSNNLTFQGEKSSDILKDTHEELILQPNSESRFEPNWELNVILNDSSNYALSNPKINGFNKIISKRSSSLFENSYDEMRKNKYVDRSSEECVDESSIYFRKYTSAFRGTWYSIS